MPSRTGRLRRARFATLPRYRTPPRAVFVLAAEAGAALCEPTPL
ncbi:hypothetical protein [Streptomyces misionensis]|nr:hypothetical protein [Streptomyces misionensis]